MLGTMKRYDIMITGKVQDVGYRDLVVGRGRAHHLHGYVFNDVDGTVKVVCEGYEDSAKKFFAGIKVTDRRAGIEVESVIPEEIPATFSLPPDFVRLETDSMADVGRKLDRGITLLGGIKKDTAALKGIKSDTATLHDMKEILGKIEAKL